MLNVVWVVFDRIIFGRVGGFRIGHYVRTHAHMHRLYGDLDSDLDGLEFEIIFEGLVNDEFLIRMCGNIWKR